VDAAIATLLCEGAINIQSMGVGGGFLMTIYLREEKTTVSLNARETAPAAADKNMFHENATLSQKGMIKPETSPVPINISLFHLKLKSFEMMYVETYKEELD